MKLIHTAIALTLALLAVSRVHAFDLQTPGAGEDTPPVEVHGFVSQGFIVTPGNNFLEKTEQGSFALTELGINFTRPVSDRLRFGIQLFARDFAQLGNMVTKVDWFYGAYRWKDWLGFQIGRIKVPFGLYNDSSDIDSARVPVLLPMSLYPVVNRDFLLAQTGMEAFGIVDLGAGGSLDYRVYGGTIEIGAATNAVITSVSVPYLVGSRVLWETPLSGLRLGGSLQYLRVDLDALIAGNRFTVRGPVRLWVGSLEYTKNDWLFATEYSQWRNISHSEEPTIFPNGETTGERAYTMISYRVNPWFQPGVYYALYYPNIDVRYGRANQRHDIAATLRFDLSPNWLVKLEGHFMRGTIDLDPNYNEGVPITELQRDWGIFVVKTTAYF